MRGKWTVQVVAETMETAYTWQGRTSAMSQMLFYDGGRTAPYRKRPCSVREAHLSAGTALGGGSAGRHVERVEGASESWWRIVMAQVQRK